jgi:uncharacterized protein (DUF433 family)
VNVVTKSKTSKLLDAPAYTLREATRLTGIGFGTLHSWSRGKNPIIRLDGNHWSFTNLVEAHTLRALRKTHQLRLNAVRKAVRYVESKLGDVHPLASKAFRTDGVSLFVDRFGKLINASAEGQIEIRELLDARLKQIEYGRDGRATRLFLDGDRKLIVIDPAISFGRPVITGTRVPVDMIVSRFDAGEEPADIAKDYDIGEGQVHQAIRMSVKAHAA